MGCAGPFVPPWIRQVVMISLPVAIWYTGKCQYFPLQILHINYHNAMTFVSLKHCSICEYPLLQKYGVPPWQEPTLFKYKLKVSHFLYLNIAIWYTGKCQYFPSPIKILAITPSNPRSIVQYVQYPAQQFNTGFPLGKYRPSSVQGQKK